MSTLDDAREGMHPDIRPQDDLFGHVNGRWLETAEIPADKGSWGSFVHLSDAAEEQVHAIIDGLAERVATGEEGLGDDAMRIACLYASFMDEQAVETLGYEPLRPLLGAVDTLRDARDLSAFLGEFEQIGGSGAFGIYVDVDGKNSDRTLLNVVQGGLGLPDESYYHDEKFAEIREKYVAFLTRMFELVERPDAAAAAATVMAVETRLSQGHWERAETRDVQKTYNLLTVDELHALCPGFDWEVFTTQPRRFARDDRRDLHPAAVLPRAPLERPRRRCRSRTGAPGWPRASCVRTRRTSPLSSSRPTSTSTAAPWAARPSCASAGSAASLSSRARSARRSGVSTSRATSRPTPRR